MVTRGEFLELQRGDVIVVPDPTGEKHWLILSSTPILYPGRLVRQSILTRRHDQENITSVVWVPRQRGICHYVIEKHRFYWHEDLNRPDAVVRKNVFPAN